VYLSSIYPKHFLQGKADITAGIQGHLIFISVFDAFLSITAFLGNALVLFALHKESSLNPPSKHLLRSLATTDICVGLIVEPLYVTLLVTAVNEHWKVCHPVEVAVYMISSILMPVSLLTLTAISVDRLLALLLGLRYSNVVRSTPDRAVRVQALGRYILLCCWATHFTLSASPPR